MIILASLVFAGIIAFEAPRLIKNRLWREMIAFSGLLVVGLVYSFGLALSWPLPNPVKLLKAVFLPVTQYLERLLTP